MRVVSLLRMFFRGRKESVEMVQEALALLDVQRVMLQEAARQIAEWQDRALTSHRATRDLAIAFRIQQETPELDIREDLDKLVRELSDSVALLEEHLT